MCRSALAANLIIQYVVSLFMEKLIGAGGLTVSTTEIQATKRTDLTRIIVADDHPAFRGILSYLLRNEASLKVVGEAADGIEALALCRQLQPDLVIMDLKMPKMDGWEATREIKKEFPHTLVLLLTAFADPGDFLKAVEVGADGYVPKYTPLKAVIDATRRVLSGERVLNRDML
jgi:DNA-binding NarL/FixJ family response regulator